MKKLISLFILLMSITSVFAQKSYVQVEGEPNLKVYLNNNFKGVTSQELGGFIIENVNPGPNTIKVVKDEYAPYEEKIQVKAGEVLTFKVKPFQKHVVNFTENGNTESTNKQTALKTGRLIIQSLPIEIKVTIPQIEGVNGFVKKKDQWTVESIPEGKYKIIFEYKKRKITKIVDVDANETTSVFANMLNGEIEIKNTIVETRARLKKEEGIARIMDSLATTYQFKRKLSMVDFYDFNPGARKFVTRKEIQKGASGVMAVSSGSNGYVFYYQYCIKGGSRSDDDANNTYYADLKSKLLKVIPEGYIQHETFDRANKNNYFGQILRIKSKLDSKYNIEIVFKPSGNFFFQKDSSIEIHFIDEETSELTKES